MLAELVARGEERRMVARQDFVDAHLHLVLRLLGEHRERLCCLHAHERVRRIVALQQRLDAALLNDLHGRRRVAAELLHLLQAGDLALGRDLVRHLRRRVQIIDDRGGGRAHEGAGGPAFYLPRKKAFGACLFAKRKHRGIRYSTNLLLAPIFHSNTPQRAPRPTHTDFDVNRGTRDESPRRRVGRPRRGAALAPARRRRGRPGRCADAIRTDLHALQALGLVLEERDGGPED